MRRRLVTVTASAACIAMSACADYSAGPEPTSTVPVPIVVGSADGGATATVDRLPSRDACGLLTEDVARRSLGVSADVRVTNTVSGERCTWQVESDPSRAVTLLQDVQHEPSQFFASHLAVKEVTTDDQRRSGLRVGVETKSSFTEITMLLVTQTLVLQAPRDVADIDALVREMLSMG